MIRSQGESLLRIIDDVLDFGRISAGTMEMEERLVELRPLLLEMDALFGPRVRARGLTWKLDLQEIPELMVVDPVRLKQILGNLLNNAVKFTSKGSISLHVRGVRQSSSAQVVFSVADTGIGIKGEHTSRLFNAFSQATEDIARRFGGTGLGLAISQQLAIRMGGQITLESTYGAGSTFTLVLPVRELQGFVPTSETTAVSFSAKALIVDDNAVNLTVLEAMLAQLGIAVESAQTGAAALDRLKQESFEVVLTDLELDDMSGFELVRTGPSDTYYVAVSAYPRLEKRAECLRAGFLEYIEKPVRLQTLTEVLTRILPGKN